jgi:phage terminase Nu1 subunit (DNA packaging protein)
MTRQELARAIGVHPQTITKWEAEGMPVARRGGRGVASRYSLPAVFAWRMESLRSVAGTTLSLEQERQRLTRINADTRELQLAERRRELLPREQVVLQGQAVIRGWAAIVRGLPRRLVNAGVVPREQEPAAKGVVYELLTAISQWKTIADVEIAIESEGQHGR